MLLKCCFLRRTCH